MELSRRLSYVQWTQAVNYNQHERPPIDNCLDRDLPEFNIIEPIFTPYLWQWNSRRCYYVLKEKILYIHYDISAMEIR